MKIANGTARMPAATIPNEMECLLYTAKINLVALLHDQLWAAIDVVEHPCGV